MTAISERSVYEGNSGGALHYQAHPQDRGPGCVALNATGAGDKLSALLRSDAICCKLLLRKSLRVGLNGTIIAFSSFTLVKGVTAPSLTTAAPADFSPTLCSTFPAGVR